MEFLSKLMAKEGAEISGSDLRMGGHDKKNVVGADEVVYSFAIGGDNPEYSEALKRRIPLTSRAELLGRVSSGYKSVVAVSGTHGKTTTTAMLMCALMPLNPTVHVGGTIGGVSGNIGGKDLFITEACEYKESFMALNPDAAIILNVELDHADYYKTYANFYDAFERFAARSKVAFVCGDNEAVSLRGKDETFTFGLSNNNDYYAVIDGEDNGFYTFSAYYRGEKFGMVKLGVRGLHNVTNAMGVLAYCHHFKLGFSGIADFKGVDRRFESLCEYDGIEYISDYAHHPHEIECTLAAAKKVFKRVLVVFEPHTYSRTQAFFKGFADTLALADECILLPIYPAREQPIEGVSSEIIANEGGFSVAHGYDEASKMISERAKLFDCVIFMGAGSVDDFAREYVRGLK